MLLDFRVVAWKPNPWLYFFGLIEFLVKFARVSQWESTATRVFAHGLDWQC